MGGSSTRPVGLGGNVVQSARFVEEHTANGGDLSVDGQEASTKRCRSGEDEPCNSRPPEATSARATLTTMTSIRAVESSTSLWPIRLFNVAPGGQGATRRMTSGFRSACRPVDNANYLWIQIFYSALSYCGYPLLSDGMAQPPTHVVRSSRSVKSSSRIERWT